MDIKLKSYSHSIITKIIVFILVIVCFTGGIISLINTLEASDGDFKMTFDDNYFLSREYMSESTSVLEDLTKLIIKYKSEEYVLNGGTITEEQIRMEEENLFSDFQDNSNRYNHSLSSEENYEEFKKIYATEIANIKSKLIQNDLREFKMLLQRLKDYKGVLYYTNDGKNTFTNSSEVGKEYFKSHPSYMIFEGYETEVHPEEIKNNGHYNWMLEDVIVRATEQTNELAQENTEDQEKNTIYIAFTEEYLNPKIKEWKENKEIMTDNIYRLVGFSLGLAISFIYLAIVVGRKSFKDKELHLNSIDRLPNDINLLLCFTLMMLSIVFIDNLGYSAQKFHELNKVTIPIISFIASLGLILVISLIKHFKNNTLIKNTLTYTVCYKLYKFIRDIYNSGSVGVKIVLIVIIYPALVAGTFFMFPITIGLAAWLALKRVKQFNEIKEGVEKIKDGDMNHVINVSGDGEFGKLSANINSITDGLKKSVNNELKSERLKTELITNVSHDIRTPLTSIITYVDLLKREEDREKSQEYIEILDQKAQRLKTLTDDLFEATKASSGSIPVNFEKIDMISLITQGLGELNDKIEQSELKFKINHPNDKVYVRADGKLLWRVIENLLSNIFKYALKGSRVYVDIEESENTVNLIIKNISAYELNISANELMERFKRGDESRSSQGSGLGLSIAKSLISIQNGQFDIEVDGDLFKATIQMNKYKL
ncbi:two-component system signal transduction histidine kinase [Gottschalkia acidurici 9a]|uniref:histidine kinase n=1 Tax=Gottschalkia acidurici (strain ATCC 7906 / DSM 604 / BCRC 14475 / CIP 104303 / KCTC 5404 / NCIMB 10678 / 9a) TaxID=1128398 RepID=K0B2K7_GOTA9|nr:HAMP domain-containing sensor histidine kinase [Gottschalkia acidurici]AFS79729.1 two-component system signal transduction histidine kinase [Gottschalkia acidurici 9a]